jgi:hypothetical protein
MSFRLLREYFSERWGTSQTVPLNYPRVFTDGVLRGLGIGATVDVSPAIANFVLMGAAGAFIKQPAAQLRVCMYGVAQEDGDMKVHRFYLSANGAQPDYLLEVVTQYGNVLEGEIKFYQKLDEVNPMSSSEWDMWLEGADGNPPLLGGIYLNWSDDVKDAQFTRAWGVDSDGNGADAIDPRELEEHIVDSSNHREEVTQYAMLYGRMIGDPAMPEWIMLSRMCLNEGEDDQSVWIEAYIGITLTPGEFTIY